MHIEKVDTKYDIYTSLHCLSSFFLLLQTMNIEEVFDNIFSPGQKLLNTSPGRYHNNNIHNNNLSTSLFFIIFERRRYYLTLEEEEEKKVGIKKEGYGKDKLYETLSGKAPVAFPANHDLPNNGPFSLDIYYFRVMGVYHRITLSRYSILLLIFTTL